MEEKCLKTLSEYCERRCRCHVWWKTVPEGGAGNWKSPFADGGEVERRYCARVCTSAHFSAVELLIFGINYLRTWLQWTMLCLLSEM